MKITVKARTGTRQQKVSKIEEFDYEVWIKQQPIKGKANETIIKLLATYFNISKSRVALVHGNKSKLKIFEIDL